MSRQGLLPGASLEVMAESPHSPTVTTAVRAHYLEALWYMEEEGVTARPGMLAEWLGVRAPTATETIKRLERDGLVTSSTSPHRIDLTDSGRELAHQVVRRHRIIERWLSEQLGLDWVSADQEAQALVPALSDTVIDRLFDHIGHPHTCPHGNPIPGTGTRPENLIPLPQLKVGEAGIISRISELAEHDAADVLSFLESSQLIPGTTVMRLASKDPDVIEVDIKGKRTPIGLRSASAVHVSPSSA